MRAREWFAVRRIAREQFRFVEMSDPEGTELTQDVWANLAYELERDRIMKSCSNTLEMGWRVHRNVEEAEKEGAKNETTAMNTTVIKTMAMENTVVVNAVIEDTEMGGT